jgi:hypothetical protein
MFILKIRSIDMYKSQQADSKSQKVFLGSKQANPEFQAALKAAIQDFRTVSLRKHHLSEIAIMERVVNNSNQTNRELRDSARKACQQINSDWRNWVVKSLLTDYVTEVLNAPRFNVEKMYETEIDRLDKTVDLQGRVIEQLEQEKEKWRKDPQYYNKELEEKLNNAESFIKNAEKKLEEYTTALTESKELNKLFKKMLDERQSDHQVLYTNYLRTADTRQFPIKKQFKAPSPTPAKLVQNDLLKQNQPSESHSDETSIPTVDDKFEPFTFKL